MKWKLVFQKAYSDSYVEGYKYRTGHYPSDETLLIAIPASITGLIHGFKYGFATCLILSIIGRLIWELFT